jgi:hypothetical protein
MVDDLTKGAKRWAFKGLHAPWTLFEQSTQLARRLTQFIRLAQPQRANKKKILWLDKQQTDDIIEA